MTDAAGATQIVCEKFCLATLGYCKTSSVVSVAKESPTSSVAARPNGRGRKRKICIELHEQMDSHIRSFD